MSIELDSKSLTDLAFFVTTATGVVGVATAMVGIVGLLKAPEATAEVMLTMVQSGSVIRLGTAIVIVLAIFGLTLTDKISGEAAVAALSGIAGYLLGGQNVPKLRRRELSASLSDKRPI